MDIVGPVCETGDCLLHDWPLGDVKPAISRDLGRRGLRHDAGLQLQRPPPPPEVFVAGNKFRLIRRRESPSDLLRGQVRT